MVLFSAPWCGYCKQAAPAWTRAAETLSPLIPFYNVDCDEEANKRFCASEGVQGYPTIKVSTCCLMSGLRLMLWVGVSQGIEGRWKGVFWCERDKGYGGLRDEYDSWVQGRKDQEDA